MQGAWCKGAYYYSLALGGPAAHTGQGIVGRNDVSPAERCTQISFSTIFLLDMESQLALCSLMSIVTAF